MPDAVWEAIGDLREGQAKDRVALAAVDRLDREVFGNGSPGLAKRVTELRTQVKVAVWVLALLQTVLAGVIVGMLS